MRVFKGDTVIIRLNSVFDAMGFHKVQGKVASVRADGVSFLCKQTGAYETVDFNDGTWTVISADTERLLKREYNPWDQSEAA